MLSKLWQNSVLTSAVESYCLPCKSHLRSRQEAELHVAKPEHRKALDAAPYVDGYQVDRIRKVPSGFYCEFCNLLFTTSSKVALHVSDPSHISTKGNQQLKREGTSIIAFNNVSISEKAWNGFQVTTCVVCSKDFVFENIHKSEEEHIIKLIQSKIKFSEDNAIFRKTEVGYQCLTCNVEFLESKYDGHFSSTEHKDKYEQCKITISSNHVDENHNENDTIDKENSKKDFEKPKEVKKADTPKEEVKKEAIKQEAKKPKVETKTPVNGTNNISKDNTVLQDPVKNEANKEMIEFAKKHGLEVQDNYYRCNVCGVNLHTNQVKRHVNSKAHKNRVRTHKNETPEQAQVSYGNKVLLGDFMKDATRVEKLGFSDIVINSKYCLNILSYIMCTTHDGQVRCQACSVNLTIQDVDKHNKEPQHIEKLRTIMVVTSIDDEFIREVQPQVLHCGYCNLVVKQSDMSNHLASTQHKDIKRTMLARLDQYLPMINRETQQKAGIVAFLRAMLKMNDSDDDADSDQNDDHYHHSDSDQNDDHYHHSDHYQNDDSDSLENDSDDDDDSDS